MFYPRPTDDDDRLDYDTNEDDGEDFTDDVYFDGPEDFYTDQDESDDSNQE